jgi:beta-phosphoglucomutase-like phosphatase (HAD superfamily)
MARPDPSTYVIAFIALGITAAWQFVFGDPALGLPGALAAGFALRCAFLIRALNAARAERAKVRHG